MRDIDFIRNLSRYLALIVVLGLATTTHAAFAQGFMVKPMRMEVAPIPGRPLDVPLQIRNTAGDEAKEIDLRLVELTQGPEGHWRISETDQGIPVVGPYSSIAWTSLPESRATIGALQSHEILVHFDVPPDARGAYVAGIIAETPLPPNADGIRIRVRFLIPVIIEIAGRPVRQHVELNDIEVALQDASPQTPATTTASLVIANDGRTFSRIQGTITVERQTENQWRPVTRLDVPERSILPGVTLALAADMERRLPSGRYRLRGELFVDGRRVPPIVKEIDFAGDPTVDSLSYDTALILTPGTVTLDVVPGATRTATLTIDNPGTDPVKVSMSSQTPVELGGVQMGELMGIDLSAEPWTEIRPAEFTIRPGRKQNVRVISRIPAEGAHYPNYYADLVLKGEYENGQSAGTTRSTVHLANSQEVSAPGGVVEQLELQQGEPGQYFVQSRLTNTGNVDLEPLARLYLLTPQGRQLRNVELSGDEGMLLPLGKRTYGAELDFAGIEPGYYAVRAVFGIGESNDVVRQQVVRVDLQETTGADGKKITIPIVSVETDNPEIVIEDGSDNQPALTLDGATAEAAEE